MNIKYKLYLSLGLLLSVIESTTFATAVHQGYSIAQIEQYCEDVIHTIDKEQAPLLTRSLCIHLNFSGSGRNVH